MRLISVLVGLSFVLSSCASYRVVPFTRGVDSEGAVHDFYAVAHNNVIIPEYVINERGEYPTDPKVAWALFRERRSRLESQMRTKYKTPGDFSYSVQSALLGAAFFVVFPITFPLYYFGSGDEKKSPKRYFELMMYGTSPLLPGLKDEFQNF